MNTISPAQEAIRNRPGPQGAPTGASRRARRRFTHNVVVNCPKDCHLALGPILASFILDGVRQIHLAGPDGSRVKSLIDSILARGEFDVQITTTWYEGESLDSVISFARGYCHQPSGGTQIVYL